MNNTNSDSTPPLKQQVMKSLAWLGGLKYSGQIISWGITIYVIRLLNPSDYGLMAMATVCISFFLMLSELGLGAAIVQKQYIEKQQLAQVFGFIIVINCFLYGALFISAPLLGLCFSESRLVPIVRVLAINLILMSLYVIPQSLMVKNMNFSSKSIVDFSAALVAAITTLLLAIYGFGVWALVYGTLTFHMVSILGYNVVAMTFLFPSLSFKGVRDLACFGGYVTGARILWYVYSRADIFIGGLLLGKDALGIYSVALHLASVPLEKLMPLINQVAYPAYSTIQSDLPLVRTHFLKSLRLIALLAFPIFLGMLVVAPEMIGILLGEKWACIVLPFQVICVMLPFRALNTLFAPMLTGLGRPDVLFTNHVIASILMPLSFIIGLRWEIIGLCFSWLVGYMIVFPIMSRRSLKVIGLSVIDLVSEIKYPIISSIVMVFCVMLFKIHFDMVLTKIGITIISIVMGTSLYALFMFMLRRDTYSEVYKLFQSKGG